MDFATRSVSFVPEFGQIFTAVVELGIQRVAVHAIEIGIK